MKIIDPAEQSFTIDMGGQSGGMVSQTLSRSNAFKLNGSLIGKWDLQ